MVTYMKILLKKKLPMTLLLLTLFLQVHGEVFPYDYCASPRYSWSLTCKSSSLWLCIQDLQSCSRISSFNLLTYIPDLSCASEG